MARHSAPSLSPGFTPTRWDRVLARIGLQGLGNLPRAVRPPATLAIAHLPEPIAALPHNLNTAITGPEGLLWDVWRQQLLQALLDSAPVFVMASSQAEMDQMLASPAAQDAWQRGRLQAWVLPAAQQQALAQAHALPELLTELHMAGLRPSQALLCTNGSALLEHIDLRQLEQMSNQWRNWSLHRSQPAVWCFPMHPANPQVRNVVSALSRGFLYAAHLEDQGNDSALLLERWDSPHGALFNTRYGLQLDDGVLSANGSIERGAQARMEQAPDADTVYATTACLHQLRTLPTHWVSVDGWPEAEAIAHSAIGATLLLDAGQAEQFETLAALVYRLRTSHPRTLKIVVQETVSRLRTHHEQALLYLGANDVLYKEMRFARVIRRIQDLRDQVFPHMPSAEWHSALQDFLPVPAHGYQPPERFITLLRQMLEQAQRHELDHSLVQLHLLPHVSHSMALQSFCGTRAGDVLTADRHSLWLFLYACREVDVDHTIPRVFSLPQENLFSSQTTYTQLHGIAEQLDHLQEEEQEHPLPDYRNLLAGLDTPHAPAPQPTSTEHAPALPQALERPPTLLPTAASAQHWQASPLSQRQPASETAP